MLEKKINRTAIDYSIDREIDALLKARKSPAGLMPVDVMADQHFRLWSIAPPRTGALGRCKQSVFGEHKELTRLYLDAKSQEEGAGVTSSMEGRDQPEDTVPAAFELEEITVGSSPAIPTRATNPPLGTHEKRNVAAVNLVETPSVSGKIDQSKEPITTLSHRDPSCERGITSKVVEIDDDMTMPHHHKTHEVAKIDDENLIHAEAMYRVGNAIFTDALCGLFQCCHDSSALSTPEASAIQKYTRDEWIETHDAETSAARELAPQVSTIHATTSPVEEAGLAHFSLPGDDTLPVKTEAHVSAQPKVPPHQSVVTAVGVNDKIPVSSSDVKAVEEPVELYLVPDTTTQIKHPGMKSRISTENLTEDSEILMIARSIENTIDQAEMELVKLMDKILTGEDTTRTYPSGVEVLAVGE